jgi:orotate phosphoribosyltransferase-like protein
VSVAPNFVVDWSELLNDLRRRGLRTRQIAENLEMSHSTLVEYGQGVKSPLHANGERLIAYWCSVTSKTREEVPHTQAFRSAHLR